jgi:hypothetical protein
LTFEATLFCGKILAMALSGVRIVGMGAEAKDRAI